MQQRFRSVDLQSFRSVEVGSEAARQLLEAKDALELRRGTACDIAETSYKQAFHDIILAS